MSDAELCRQCRAGQHAAWRELLRRHAAMVYRLAIQILGQAADAEDASQETFMRMHQSFDAYDATRPLAPWIARIAVHVCLRRLEGKVSRATTSTEPLRLADTLAASAPNPEETTAQREAQRLLGEALAGLSPEDRALLCLRYKDGLSDSEVADAADMPVNTVKTRIFRARARLRDLLGPVLGGQLA